MNIFKIGDRVRVVRGSTNEHGYEFTVKIITENNIYYPERGNGDYERNLELVESKKSFMATLKSIWRNLNASEPEKSFRKAGIVNDSGELTSEGYEIFSSYLLKRFGDDFKKEVVDGIIHEMEMDNCNK